MSEDFTGTSVTILGVHYAPEMTGNAPYTTAMAEALASAGASVRVITGVPHYPQWKVTDGAYRRGLRWSERRNGVAVERVRHFVPARPNLIGRAALELTFLVQCIGVASRDRSDAFIAITPTLSGLAASLLCRRRRPVGVLVQDLTGASAVESGTSSSKVGAFIGKLEYWLLKRTSRIGIIASHFGAVLTANGIDGRKLVDLPNFSHITPVEATPQEARARLGWNDSFSVVHTGNIGMKQGLEAVVDAAKLAQKRGIPVQFVLVGDGNQRSKLKEAAGGCANLSFVDPLSAGDYPYALAAADVLLVNERRGVREMSLPSKITSYTVAGRPIIAAVESDGITADTLQGCAVICRPGDPGALMDSALAVLNCEIAVQPLIDQAAALHQRRYCAQSAIERYQKFLVELTEICDIPAVRLGG